MASNVCCVATCNGVLCEIAQPLSAVAAGDSILHADMFGASHQHCSQACLVLQHQSVYRHIVPFVGDNPEKLFKPFLAALSTLLQ